MAKNPFESYKQTQINTAQQGQLILMMYEGAIGFLQQAKVRMERGDIEGKGMFLNKAIGVVSGLNTALDEEKGGEIAKNLRSLYFFMNRHLTKANMKNDMKMVDEIISLLKTLNEGWKTIVEGKKEGFEEEKDAEQNDNSINMDRGMATVAT